MLEVFEIDYRLHSKTIFIISNFNKADSDKFQRKMAIFYFLALLSCSAVLAVDQTKQPGAVGPEVVEAVVNLIRESCLFADDKRYLRRLAYVESQDGTAPNTYRFGYDGGIWQVYSSLQFIFLYNIWLVK